jgi:hypothetical protein
MTAKLHMHLDDLPSKTTATIEVELVLSDTKFVLETARKNIGNISFKEAVEFVEGWSRRANESRIVLDIEQEVAAELMYGAYWICNKAQVQIRSVGLGMVSVSLAFNGDISDTIEIVTIDAGTHPQQVSSWMAWAASVVDIPGGLTFVYDKELSEFVPDSIPTDAWMLKAQTIQEAAPC